MRIPSIINEINKAAKTSKIAPLNECDALELRRMFSGSIAIDYLTGGGFGYRRVHLLYGTKSSGKNATLNQTIAYNQRICRKCHGLRGDYWFEADEDRHAQFLRFVLQLPQCKCDTPQGKVFLFLDYEKSISKEGPSEVTVKKIFDPNTEQLVDELDYDELLIKLEEFKTNSVIEGVCEEEKKKAIASMEKYLSTLKIEEETITRVSPTDYLAMCGVLVNELLIADPEDTEEGIEHARSVIPSLEIDGIVWDSLQAAIPKWVKERDADADSMGKEAKQNALMLRHVCSKYASGDIKDPAQAYKPPFFITSQLRSSLSSFYAADTYSGGHAVKHHTSLALEYKRTCFISDDGSEANTKNKKPYFGQTIKLRAEKNKLAPPETTAEIDLYFSPDAVSPVGIDHVKEIALLGIRFGAIEQAGAWYRVGDDKFNGLPKFIEFCRANPEFVGKVYNELREKFKWQRTIGSQKSVREQELKS